MSMHARSREAITTYRHLLGIMLLALALFVPTLPSGTGTAAAAEPVARWEEAPRLAVPRSGPHAFSQPDGRILLYGGAGEGKAASEYYDPARGSSGAAGKLEKNVSATVTPLPDGRLLVAGGLIAAQNSTTGNVVATTTLYDPATGREERGAPLATERAGHTATALRDGTVLVAGGFTAAGVGRTIGAGPVAQAERFDPRTGRWSPAGSLAAPRGDHAAALLPDGRVLVVGGFAVGVNAHAETEIYDPATNRWATAIPMTVARKSPHLVTLADGSLLVFGEDDTIPERYDPTTGRWATAGTIPQARAGIAAARLADGRVLLAGGEGTGGVLSAATHLFDPVAGAWSAGPPLLEARAYATLVAVPDGRALLLGGQDNDRRPLATSRLFTTAPTREQCFAETGQCLRSAILEAWEARGGLALNGLPLGPEVAETLEDGRVYLVQYCERARFELHPEAPAPYRVQLGQFGRRVLAARLGAQPQAAPLTGARHFPETAHNVAGDFLAFWEGRGGLSQFGLPLSEELRETLEDGKPYTVQYFERARFELHPAAGGTVVQLGQFGRAILAENALLDPRLRDRYVAWEGLRARLGAPTGAATTVPGAALGFIPRGEMLYLAPTKTIVALCYNRVDDPTLKPAPTGSVRIGSYALLPDTWDESQPAGGGRINDRGEYEPSRGFGKAWRENPVWRDCLGPATSPSERSTTIVVQEFQHGRIVLDVGFNDLYALLVDDAGRPTGFISLT